MHDLIGRGRVIPALIAASTLCCGSGWAGEIVQADLVRLPEADVVILGELHDNADHHRNQARVLAALHPSAVVFEMLNPDQAALVNSLDARDATLAGAINWSQSGWPDWSLYAPIFFALRDAVVYGMALPRDTVRAAVTDGAAAVFPGDPGRFGLSTPLSRDEQSERETEQREVHCFALPEDLLPGMVEAQRLRDAAFAQTTLRALQETGGPVVVITGNGHARTDHGMPRALRQVDPAVRIIALGQLEATPEDMPPFDLWLVTDPASRDDPCAAFE